MAPLANEIIDRLRNRERRYLAAINQLRAVEHAIVYDEPLSMDAVRLVLEASSDPATERMIRLECLKLAQAERSQFGADRSATSWVEDARQLAAFVLGDEAGCTVKVKVSAGEP